MRQNIFLEEFDDRLLGVDLYKNMVGYIEGDEVVVENFTYSDEECYIYSSYSPFARELYTKKDIQQITREEPLNTLRKKIFRYIKIYDALEDKRVLFKYLIPQNLLLQYYKVREEKIQQISIPKDFYESDEFYHYVRMKKFLLDLSCREVKADRQNISHKRSHRKSMYYNQYNKTARLSESKLSFSLLSLKKEFRKFIFPQNDVFINVDMVSADPSMFLSMLSPDEYASYRDDVYVFFSEILGMESDNRSLLKKSIFEVLYSDKVYDVFGDIVEELIEGCYRGNTLCDAVGRKYEVERKNVIPYLMQSNTSNVINEYLFKVTDEFKLQGLKSEVAFIIHDNFVVDCCYDEQDIVLDIIQNNSFSDIMGVDFNYSIEVGKNLGE